MPAPYRYISLVSPIYRAAGRLIRNRVYAGESVACPVCERTFRAWLSNARDGTCPYCGSGARHRFLWLYLTEEWKTNSRPLELLHFSPEWCLERRLRGHFCLTRYVTADLSAPGVDVHVDMKSMMFANKSFDVIICSHVLEHIPDDRAAMRELVRVLRPGGIAYIQVPCNTASFQTDEDPSITDPKERGRRFGQFDHVRQYGRDVVYRLREAGFNVTEVLASTIIGEQMTRYGLWEDFILRCER